ncbi:hypothetical protein WP2_14 [Lactococcus phage WP-2]|uniref:Uncharacterized protein n=1 Tax=Lactococcus phage WP-2 TaxID=1486423 RepID=A0A024B3T3_9CAUD|nr:hypothetical protein WP2_14 [Lactococcus phage WP-2]AHZ10886.1 hypothetical protein WP2_14 [Lactococcus phage WP-2]
MNEYEVSFLTTDPVEKVLYFNTYKGDKFDIRVKVGKYSELWVTEVIRKINDWISDLKKYTTGFTFEEIGFIERYIKSVVNDYIKVDKYFNF